MFCHRCGQRLLGDTPEFCTHCGARVPDRPAALVPLVPATGTGTEEATAADSAPALGTESGDGEPGGQPEGASQGGPGYYPDPLDPSSRRYWTGSAWVAKPGDSVETASLLSAGPSDRRTRRPRRTGAARTMGIRPQDLDPMHSYRESSPRAVRRRLRRRIVRWGLVGVAAAGLIALTMGPSLLAAFDQKEQRAIAATASPSPTVAGQHEVIYEIAGDGIVDWQWATPTGFDQESAAPASDFDPKSGGTPMTTAMKSGDLAQSTVTNVQGGRTVVCRIKIDGIVVVETQSDGPRAMAHCEYKVP